MEQTYVVKQPETLKKIETISIISALLGIKMFENNNGRITTPILSTKIQIIFICSIQIASFYRDLLGAYRYFNNINIISMTNMVFITTINSCFLLASLLPIFVKPNMMIKLIEELDKVEKHTKARFFGENLQKTYRYVILTFLIVDILTTITLVKLLFNSAWNTFQFVCQCMLDVMRIKCCCLIILIIFYVNSINRQLIHYPKNSTIIMGVELNHPIWFDICGENDFDKNDSFISLKKLRKVYIRLLNCVDIICSIYKIIVINT